MPVLVITGLPGSGKSLRAARITLSLLRENKRWMNSLRNPDFELERVRPVVTNIKLSEAVEKEFGVGSLSEYIKAIDDKGPWRYGIVYWEHTADLVKVKDCDVIWDEMAADIDAHDHASISRDIKRWFAQHRKRHIRIVGITQDFVDVDISLRKKTDDLEKLTKVIGSRDPSPNEPPVRVIWGVTRIERLDPVGYTKAATAQAPIEEQEKPFQWPRFFLWGRGDCEVYDSYAEVQTGDPPPLRHIERCCTNALCNHVKVQHI